MSETIHDGRFVELTYKVVDKKSGHILTRVDFPLGYIHGHNENLAPAVHKQLEGTCAGDVIEVPIDGNQIFGPRDDSRAPARKRSIAALSTPQASPKRSTPASSSA